MTSSLTQALNELRAERTRLDNGIAIVTQLLDGSAPPGALSEYPVPETEAPVRRTKRKWSAAAKKVAAARMRAYWRKRRKAG